MPRVADYSVITDKWVVEAVQPTITFTVPATIDTGSRSVLGFMLQAFNSEDMTLILRLNGTKVWTGNFPDGKRLLFFQEVIAAGVVQPGTNVFSVQSSQSDGHNFVQVSDAVIWWQANI